MRIGIDARFYGTLGKGLGRYTEKLITYLEKFDFENEYFVFLRHENSAEYTPRNSRFHKVIADYPWYSWREQILFPRLLMRFSLDLVHFPHFNVPLFYPKSFIVTIHDLILLHFPTVKASELPPFLYWGKYWVYRVLIASTIRRAKCILTVSEFTKCDLENQYPSSQGKTYVTLEASEPECVWSSPEEEKELFKKCGLLEAQDDILHPYCLYVGNAYPHKNLRLLLEAAEQVPKYFFVLVGKEDYFYRELRHVVRERDIKNILFVGFMSDRELGILYRRAVLYLSPSLYEGFGLPGLEACSYGLPVISSKVASLPEILGEAALYFDPQSKKEFFDKLRWLLVHPEAREELRQKGFQQYAKFSWERLARETLALYRENL